MSQPTIPNITPAISLSKDQTIVMLLSSIALEEMAMAHLVNAEAEKMQYVLGTLESRLKHDVAPNLEQLLAIQRSIGKMMNQVITKDIQLNTRLQHVLDLHWEKRN